MSRHAFINSLPVIFASSGHVRSPGCMNPATKTQPRIYPQRCKLPSSAAGTSYVTSPRSEKLYLERCAFATRTRYASSLSTTKRLRRLMRLSHTWGDDEVSLQDLEQFHALPTASQASAKVKESNGFYKIRLCCGQARRHQLEYAWIDTCCIDKTSSAELSEAINSMFKWYKNAVVCYAYLEDIYDLDTYDFEGIRDEGETSSTNAGVQTKHLDRTRNKFNEAYFSKARWFSRGWTLQELIAPKWMVFFSKDWKILGHRKDMKVLASITGIDAFVLSSGRLETICVARKMSWAGKRHTTRTEDIAYCLLGIFDLNMPLLYGEGAKAFVRLQEEIMKDSDDQSLFAWVPASANPSSLIVDLRGYFYDGKVPKRDKTNAMTRQKDNPYVATQAVTIAWEWGSQITEDKVRGVFAAHPSEFSVSSITQNESDSMTRVIADHPFALTNKGVEMDASLIVLSPTADIFLVVLNCAEIDERDSLLGIVMQANIQGASTQWRTGYGIVMEQPYAINQDCGRGLQLYRREGYGLICVTRRDIVDVSFVSKVYLSKRRLVTT